MRALMLHEKNRMSIEEVEPVGTPGPGQVRITMHTVGICASDVHYWTDGKIGPFVVEAPMILGHEGAGTVVEVGEGVTHLSPGDRVAMEPGVPDPTSRAVREGNYNVDPGVQFWATPPVHGCLVDEVIHPAAYTFKLPDNLSFAEGALIEPFSVGMYAATKAGIKPGDVAAVVGAGTIGIMTAIAARAGGASTVFISDVLPQKLALLDGLEGIVTVDATKEDLGERVRAETGGWGPQVVFEATGAAPAYKKLWEMPAPGGRIVLVGMPVDPVPFDIATAQSRGISLETVFRYANVYQKAIDLAATDGVDLSRFVSETFAFDDSVQAFERFLEGTADGCEDPDRALRPHLRVLLDLDGTLADRQRAIEADSGYLGKLAVSADRRCQNTTALAAATFSESTPPAIGMTTCSSTACSVAGFSPWPSAPSTKATFRSGLRSTASSSTAPSVRARASTSKPASCSRSIPAPGQASSLVHGTWKTVPIETRIERRYSGSAHCGVTSTASTPSAAAERNIAPTFMWSTMSSSTATVRASRSRSAAAGSSGRCIAASAPRWRL